MAVSLDFMIKYPLHRPKMTLVFKKTCSSLLGLKVNTELVNAFEVREMTGVVTFHPGFSLSFQSVIYPLQGFTDIHCVEK